MQSIVPYARHGGPHATHNMSDCHKYDKDSMPKKGFGKGQHGSTALDKKTASAFAQLESLRRQTRSLRRAPRSASMSMTVTVVTQTPLEGVGLVACGGTTVVSLC